MRKFEYIFFYKKEIGGLKDYTIKSSREALIFSMIYILKIKIEFVM